MALNDLLKEAGIFEKNPSINGKKSIYYVIRVWYTIQASYLMLTCWIVFYLNNIRLLKIIYK